MKRDAGCVEIITSIDVSKSFFWPGRRRGKKKRKERVWTSRCLSTSVDDTSVPRYLKCFIWRGGEWSTFSGREETNTRGTIRETFSIIDRATGELFGRDLRWERGRERESGEGEEKKRTRGWIDRLLCRQSYRDWTTGTGIIRTKILGDCTATDGPIESNVT